MVCPPPGPLLRQTPLCKLQSFLDQSPGHPLRPQLARPGLPVRCRPLAGRSRGCLPHAGACCLVPCSTKAAGMKPKLRGHQSFIGLLTGETLTLAQWGQVTSQALRLTGPDGRKPPAWAPPAQSRLCDPQGVPPLMSPRDPQSSVIPSPYDLASLRSFHTPPAPVRRSPTEGSLVLFPTSHLCTHSSSCLSYFPMSCGS